MWYLALLAFLGPPIGGALAWWLNSKSETRQREWAVRDRDDARKQAIEDRKATSSDELSRWLRELRRVEYGRALSSSQRLVNSAVEISVGIRTGDDTGDFVLAKELDEAIGQAVLLSDQRVRVAIRRLHSAALTNAYDLRQGVRGMSNEFLAACNDFIAEAQAELWAQ